MGDLFWCRFKLDLLNLLPSLIPGLPTRPSTLFRVGSRERATKSQFPQLDFVKPLSGFHPVTWECVIAACGSAALQIWARLQVVVLWRCGAVACVVVLLYSDGRRIFLFFFTWQSLQPPLLREREGKKKVRKKESFETYLVSLFPIPLLLVLLQSWRCWLAEV